jgi:hypothetical protein
LPQVLDPASRRTDSFLTMEGEDSRTAALGRAYADLVHERDRLRDARRSVTSALGPLPAASAVAVGLFGLTSDVDSWYVVAYLVVLVLFVLMAIAGYKAATRMPYRKLRERYCMKHGWSWSFPASEATWLQQMIRMEANLYPELIKGFESERKWLLWMQAAAVVQITLLGVITVGFFLSD